MASKDSIGLFIGGDRGFAVLSALLAARRNVTKVLVLEQKSHELNRYTDKILALCQEHDIVHATSEEVKPVAYKDFIESGHLDVLFVISWRHLINKDCFNLPQKGVFVIHDALLPKNRGFAPTNWVVINQEKETGATLFYIDEGVDSGDIVDQVTVSIDSAETATSLNEKFLNVYPKIILKNLDPILNGTNKRISQDNAQATYLERRRPEDGRIDFQQSAKQIESFIRGLSYPYPGAFCSYNDEEIIIWEAEAIPGSAKEPGKISTITEHYIDVGTVDGILRITVVAKINNVSRFLKANEVIHSAAYDLN